MRFIYAVFSGSGLLLLLIGWYLLKCKRIEILSQYNSRKKYNRIALAEFAGKNLIFMGLLVILQSIVFLSISFIWEIVSVPYITIAVFLITVTYFSLKVAFGVSKFEI